MYWYIIRAISKYIKDYVSNTSMITCDDTELEGFLGNEDIFYIELAGIENALGKNYIDRKINVSIKYFMKDPKLKDLMIIQEKLVKAFMIPIELIDIKRVFKAENIESIILKDSVGKYLQFGFSLKFTSRIEYHEVVDTMSEIKTRIGDINADIDMQ